ncbi:MAG: DsbA family protein [Muricomes sp.]
MGRDKKKVEVFFDYACPFCYVGLKYLTDLLPQYDSIEIEWIAVEAHPRPEPRMDLSDRIEEWEREVGGMIHQAGLEFKLPISPIPRSDKAFEAMHYIIEHGGDVEKYHRNIYRAMFAEQKNIEDYPVILSCAEGCNLNVEELDAALKAGDYSEKQHQSLVYAYGDMKIEVVPTFISGDKRLEAAPGIGVTQEQVKEFLDSILVQTRN